MTIFSDKKFAKVESYIMYAPDSFHGDPTSICRADETDTEHFIPLVLNILDTPGLSEKSVNGTGRHDDELLDIIGKALNKELNQYHAIFFFASLESGSNRDDLEAFMKFRDLLGENAKQHMCLVITRCESKSKEQRDALLNQMKQLTEYKSMFDYFKGGIFFSGALDFDTFNVANSVGIQRQFQAVIDMRRKIVEFILTKKATIDVMNLNMSDVQRILKEQNDLNKKIMELRRLGGAKEKEVERLTKELDSKSCVVM